MDGQAESLPNSEQEPLEIEGEIDVAHSPALVTPREPAKQSEHRQSREKGCACGGDRVKPPTLDPCVACGSQDNENTGEHEKPRSPEPSIGYSRDQCQRWQDIECRQIDEQRELTAGKRGNDRQEHHGQQPTNTPARDGDLSDDEGRRPGQDHPEPDQRLKRKRIVADRRDDGDCRSCMEQPGRRVDCAQRASAGAGLAGERLGGL